MIDNLKEITLKVFRMTNIPGTPNENEWIRVILLLADTQQWINEICIQTIGSLYPPAKKLLAAKTYRLSIAGLAHILERHYYKNMRHPGTGKFIVNLPQILDLLRTAGAEPALPLPGTLNSVRVLRCEDIIGIDRDGNHCSMLSVITAPDGVIITAFPGLWH